jgi:hypothetical protein
MAAAFSHTRLAQSLYDELVTEAARAAANEIARTQHAVMLMEMRSTMLYASTSRFCINCLASEPVFALLLKTHCKSTLLITGPVRHEVKPVCAIACSGMKP